MKNYYPTISIITPSYNMLTYLKCCHASIMDQGVDVEHIVIDGGSTDGTVDWLKSQKDIIWISEKDNGMYDAINKGLKLARGEIIAYLNCDEQYLPNTLVFVKDFFEKNHSVDVIFGNFVAVDSNGDLIAYRKSHQPHKILLLSSCLYVFSCTMFFRKKIIEGGFYFDTKYKSVGDLDFVLRLMDNGYKIKHIKKYFSVFMYREDNLMHNNLSLKESQIYLKTKSKNIIIFRPILNLFRLLIKFFTGAYSEKVPFIYKIYTTDSIDNRKEYIFNKITFRLKRNIYKNMVRKQSY